MVQLFVGQKLAFLGNIPLTRNQIIPSMGIESAPPDILAWSLVKTIREKLSTGTKEAISSVHEAK